MSTATTNVGLVKPAGTDAFNRAAYNANQDAIDAAFVPLAAKGAASGVATLDGTAKIPLAQIPTSIPAANLAAGAATDAVIGNRTINDATAAATGADTPSNLFSKLGNIIKQITGGASWFASPVITILALYNKFLNSGGHRHTGVDGDGPQILAAGLANGAVTDGVIGNRTVNDVTTPAAGPSPLTTILSQFGNLIKNITGGANWYTAPTTTLAALLTAVGLRAPLASPSLTGTPTAPTPATTDNSTTIATTAFVKAQGAGFSINAVNAWIG